MDMIAQLIPHLNMYNANQSNVAMITFSNQATLRFSLTKYSSRNDTREAILKVPYERGTTNTGAALRLLGTSVFTGKTPFLNSPPNLYTVSLRCVCMCKVKESGLISCLYKKW